MSAELKFSPGNGFVIAHDGGRSYRLTPNQVERLLDVWEEIEAAPLFNRLHQAYQEMGGVERATSMRAA